MSKWTPFTSRTDIPDEDGTDFWWILTDFNEPFVGRIVWGGVYPMIKTLTGSLFPFNERVVFYQKCEAPKIPRNVLNKKKKLEIKTDLN